jgi:hypothetical protein
MNRQKKSRRKRPPIQGKQTEPFETKTAETITVAWTVALTTVLLCDLGTVIAHTYVATHPLAQRMDMLGGLLLFAGALAGPMLIGLLPVLYRVRRVAPPPGLVGFSILIAAAPILALAVQILGAGP